MLFLSKNLQKAQRTAACDHFTKNVWLPILDAKYKRLSVRQHCKEEYIILHSLVEELKHILPDSVGQESHISTVKQYLTFKY